LKSLVFLFRSSAVATLFSVVSVSYAQENTPNSAQSARPPMRALVDQLSTQERMELRKQLRQHAREHGSIHQAPSAIPNPAPIAPTPIISPAVGNPKDNDRLTGIERQQLRAQLREAKMREEQERQDREAKQNQRAKSGGGKPNPPPAK
jgi:uncharacterized membrane protein